MSKLYRLGEGRSKTGKILDRNTVWFSDLNELFEFIVKNPKYTKKQLYVSANGRSYVKTTLDKCRKEINHVNRT